MLKEMGPDYCRTPTPTLLVSICKAPISRPRHAGAKDGKWLGGRVGWCRCIHANLHRRPVYIWILASLLGARGVVRSWAVAHMCGSDPAVVSGSDPCYYILAGAVHGRYPVQGLGTQVWPQERLSGRFHGRRQSHRSDVGGSNNLFALCSFVFRI